MKKETRSRKRRSSLAEADEAELVFVVDVSSLTEKGFVGTTTYHGKQVDLEFDDGGEGIFLTSEMAGRLHVRKGSALSVIMENERSMVTKATMAGVGRAPRISDPKIYYAVGREGGAIVRIRKG
jgi:ABC-type lipoprotein release transport system permease subunit